MAARDLHTASNADITAQVRERVTPLLASVEEERQSLARELTRRRMIAGGGIGALVLLALVVGLPGWIGGKDGAQFLMFGFLAACGLAWYWAGGPKRQFRKLYKTRIIPKIASCFGEFRYDPRGGIRMGRLKPSDLIPSHDSYRPEDFFQGTYNDVGIEFCEARLTETRGSGKNRHTVTVFSGVFVLLRMNKVFQGKTIVRKDAGTIGNWLRGTLGSLGGGLERVALEDPEFESRFEVYSNDQVEARYLLTPAFMTRLDELARTMAAKGLQAAFYDSMLMIMLGRTGGRVSFGNLGNFGNVSVAGFDLAMSGGNMFEPGSIYAPVGTGGDVTRLCGEFQSILGIVDWLQLDQKTGL